MHDDDTTRTDPLWTRARAMFARAVGAVGEAAAIAAIRLLTPALRRDIVAWLAPLEHVVRKLLFAEAATLHRAAPAQAGPRVARVELRSLGLAHHHPSFRLTAQRSCRNPEAPNVHVGFRDGRIASARNDGVDLARPETWPARFSFALPRDPRLVAGAHAPRIRALWGPPACHSGAARSDASGTERAPRPIGDADAPFRLARRFEALRRVLENPRPHAERLARALAREAARWREVVERYLFAPCRSNDYDPDDPRLGVDAFSRAFSAPRVFSDSS